MDTERFFSLGPGAPFETNEVFIDREAYFAAFHDRVTSHRERTWPLGELMDFQRPARNVMVIVGEGGIGKSALVRKFAGLTRDGGGVAEVIDFADPDSSFLESTLWRLRTALGSLDRAWPAFDIAFALYWERKGGTLGELARRLSRTERGGGGLGADIAGSVDELLGGVGVAGVGYRLATLATQKTTRSARIRRLKRELPAFEILVQEQDAVRMLGYLPALLAHDLEKIRADRSAHVVCVLDTFERLQSLPHERGGPEDLIARLVYLLPNVFFVTASRRPLLWHDPIRAVGLTYGGEARWPGLAGREGTSDQFPLDGLASDTADEYLRDRLTVAGRPAIPEPIRRRIVAGAAGSPHYLELSAELFHEITASGSQPVPEQFGLPFPELTTRMMRDLSVEERDLLRTAALLEAFDEEILTTANPQVRGRQLEHFLSRRFVRHTPQTWPPYRLHEDFREMVRTCDAYTTDGWTERERGRALQRVIGHLEEMVLATWEEAPAETSVRHAQIVAAVLLVLRAAAEHRVLPPRLGHLVYTLRELGHVQVLTTLPDYADRGLPDLTVLVTAARLGARTDLGARARLAAMKEAAQNPQTGVYSSYVGLELGYLGWLVDLDEGDRHFTIATRDRGELAASAWIGLAANALRRSRFHQAMSHLENVPATRLNVMRLADLRGHLHLYHADFDAAATAYSAALQQARTAENPLYIGRGLRHLALAKMWSQPTQALELISEAWERNQTIDGGVGLAQCHMVQAMVAMHRTQLPEAERHLSEASRRLEAAGADFEFVPVEPLLALLRLAQGRNEEAGNLTSTIIAALRAERPVGPPAWAAITALWTDRPEAFPFEQIDWLSCDSARADWKTIGTRWT